MAIEIARYQFHPWARKGISAQIVEGDDLGAGTAAALERAVVPLGVTLNGAARTKQFAIVSPGDIVGVHADMVVRTEPRRGVTDHEPNYLPFVEFYDEDFAWRYTPARAAGDRLRPWLALLVLAEGEFTRGRRASPLPGITVTNPAALPPHDETWLWAHVHSNANIPDAELNDFERFLLSLNATRDEDPDQFYCRLMCPRRLLPNTAYTAFVVPAFETGRLAGVGEPPETIALVRAQEPSWNAAGAKGELPVYYEWDFRTGERVDFEELVKALVPRRMDHRVGIRDMDCSRPGFVRASDPAQELPATSPPVIGLEGALRSPDTVSTLFPDPPAARDFQVELQQIVNVTAAQPADLAQDPVITVPLYGSRHAKTSAADVVTLDIDDDGWVNDLNRDPRTRVAAGFGTRVVQKGQETYVRKAWEQVGRILEANRRIRATVFNMLVAVRYTRRTFDALRAEPLLAVTRPVLAKVMGSPTTLRHQLRESRLPEAAVAGAFRRLVRPNGKVARRLGRTTPFDYAAAVRGLNDGTLTAAPPRDTPAGLPDTNDLADGIDALPVPSAPPAPWSVRHALLLLIVLLVALALLAFATGAYLMLALVAAAAVVAYVALVRARDAAAAAARAAEARAAADRAAAAQLRDPVGTLDAQLDAIARTPPRPAFNVRIADEAATPPATPAGAGADSVEARNFRVALADHARRMAIAVPERTRAAFDLANAEAKVRQAIDPRVAFPRRLSSLVRFPRYITLDTPATLFPAMAYPDITDPIYRPLADISQDLVLPNVKLIPPNTISLLETNQKFIEAYLVGLNHEMGHELLWREYPTDERGSYFRQFWDVDGIIRPASAEATPPTPEARAAEEARRAEEHKDIPPLDTWRRDDALGAHNKRSTTGAEPQVVLVIRGDLLKRYPNTVIFAQKAVPAEAADTPRIDPKIDTDLSATEFGSELLFPQFKGELPPDIKFFGFDMTVAQARGTAPRAPFTDSLGWFFVIQEIPGEPRFGMDLTFDPGTDGLSWDDLAWDRFGADIPFVTRGVEPSFGLPPALQAMWGEDSAKMASILFQKPVMVAVHAKEMLETLTA